MNSRFGSLLLPLAVAALVLLPVARGSEAPRAAGSLREFNAERPDATEGPFTVDPGHLQLEMDVVSYSRNRLDGVRTTQLSLAPVNLRYGVTNSLELGLSLAPHLRVTEQVRGGREQAWRGPGDTSVRAKWNLWGNAGGEQAGGLIADVTLPTGRGPLGAGRAGADVLLPVAFELGAGWDAGAMTGVGWEQSESGRKAVWLNSVVLGREVAKGLVVDLEVTSAAGEGTHRMTCNMGVARRLSPNLQIDCGVNVGVTRTAPDLTVFAGLARRF